MLREATRDLDVAARSVQLGLAAGVVPSKNNQVPALEYPLTDITQSDQLGHENRRRVEGRRIVVADDDQELRETLALAMRRDGYEVIELEDGWQLLRYLATQMLNDGDCSTVDVVISDVRMPGKTGLDVLAGVQWGLRPPPFILITAFSDASMQAEATRLGAVALITKPFDLDEMRALVCAVESRRLH